MPRSSRASLSDETIQELENQFYEFLNSLSSTDRKKFFAEFLTNEEKMMMYKRLALYWCLLEGYSLAKIQQMIGVTHDTTRVYNKKKNTLSEEFKELIGRIGKSDMASLEETKKEEMAEAKHEEPAIDHSINLNPDAPIETRPIDEPMMEMHTDIKDDMHDIFEKETEDMDKKDEEMEASHTEPKDEFGMDAMPSFDDDQRSLSDDMRVKNESTESGGTMHESGGLMPSDNKEDSSEKKDDDNGDGKKKGGLAKFFGF